MRVCDGVDEADTVLLLVQPGLVDQGEDRAEGGRGGGGAVDLGEGAVDGDDVVGSLLIEPARLASILFMFYFFYVVFLSYGDGKILGMLEDQGEGSILTLAEMSGKPRVCWLLLNLSAP